MIVLFPFMTPIMIGLKLTGEHYIFYLQPRVGKARSEYQCFKFATMLKIVRIYLAASLRNRKIQGFCYGAIFTQDEDQ